MRQTVAIVQARMSSTRLPGKVLMEVAGRPAIWHLMDRLAQARSLDVVVLAIPNGPADDPLTRLAAAEGWTCFRGSEQDVLDRYYRAACRVGICHGDAIVRATGDDIMIDPRLVDVVVDLFWAAQPGVHHASNNRVPSFPYGADVEVCSFQALEEAWKEANQPEDREHVTPFIRSNPVRYPFVEVRCSEDRSWLRLSIDEAADLEFNRQVFAQLYRPGHPAFSWQDVVQAVERREVPFEARGRCGTE